MSINSMSLRDVCHRLLRQEFICPVSHPTLFNELRDDEFVMAVAAVLNPLGYQLSWVGDDDTPEVFYCALTSLDNSDERKHAETSLLTMRDQISACISFFRLVDQAGNHQIAVVNGGELPVSRLLAAIEGSETYRDQLRDLQGLPMFADSRKAKDDNDRLTSIIKAMQNQGYLIPRSDESTVFVFTGKLAYLQRIMRWLADHHHLTVEVEPETVGGIQEGLL